MNRMDPNQRKLRAFFFKGFILFSKERVQVGAGAEGKGKGGGENLKQMPC